MCSSDLVNGIGAGTGTGASIDVIIPPDSGHGAEPDSELEIGRASCRERV